MQGHGLAGGKVRGPRRDEVADELAAFANARGGILVLGVDDRTRDIVGISTDRLDLAERFAASWCRTWSNLPCSR